MSTLSLRDYLTLFIIANSLALTFFVGVTGLFLLGN